MTGLFLEFPYAPKRGGRGAREGKEGHGKEREKSVMDAGNWNALNLSLLLKLLN